MMNKSRWKKPLQIILAVSLSTSMLVACANEETVVNMEPMGVEEAHKVTFDVSGGQDVMPVAAYFGPYAATYSINGQSLPNYISEEYWADMAACGVNIMSHSITDYSAAPQEIQKNLDFGEKYGIAVVVDDSTVRNMADLDEISLEELTTQLSKYMNHPAFGGFYLLDEPFTAAFEPADVPDRDLYRYEKISPLLNNEIGIFTYENMLSSGVSANGYERYEDYLRECVDVLEPSYLCFDRYPFDERQKGLINRYFYDLAVVRKVAEDNQIPFWTFVQAGSQWSDGAEAFDSTTPYYPNEGQFDWNVNTALAFGTKGISYFPYIQPHYYAFAESTPFDFERNGMIGAWGNKNRWYYYAQDISRQIQAVDKVLMNSVSKGVLACGEAVQKDMELTKDYDVLLEGTSWRELKSVTGNALIGCFNYQGRTALYVVNYSQEYAQKIDLAFHGTINVSVIQQGETENLQGDGMTLDLLAGDAALLVFE